MESGEHGGNGENGDGDEVGAQTERVRGLRCVEKIAGPVRRLRGDVTILGIGDG